MIRVTHTIALAESEIEESFIRASGPGGQNVNKLSTAVQLRFDVQHSPSLPEPVRMRLLAGSDRRLTRDGVLVITAQRFRSQEMNRQDAVDRLVELIRGAAITPIMRRPSKPTKASKRRRVEGKVIRGKTKSLRGKPISD
jgi:ribosome-associated protein